jgi:putative DNA primase/helicase
VTDNIIPITGKPTEEIAPPFSEEAIALDFTRRHVGDIRYVAKWNRWLIWDGRRWQFDEKRRVYSLARDVCRDTAAAVNKPKEAKDIAKAKTRAAVVSLVSDDQRIAASIDHWDADPWLLNTPDGVVDLRTGEVRKARPEDYMTKIAAVGPGDECPQWLAFLEKITAKDKDLQEFLRQVSGYALTGSTREQALFFLHGKGGNGKGVFINTISGVMGDYHRTTPIETFTASMSDRHPTELAALMGARLVTASETEQGRSWAESRIKQLTGGDPISARFMRQDFFEYQPQFKLMIAGNHRPGLRSVDNAIRRRMNLIPFAVDIPKGEQDQDLENKLKEEWSGILRWMIEGCVAWQQDRLKPPESVSKATNEYLSSEDSFQTWLSECCRLGPDEWISSGKLFASWKLWSETANVKTGNRKEFSNLLLARGFKAVEKDDRGYLGLTIYQKETKQEGKPIYEPPF